MNKNKLIIGIPYIKEDQRYSYLCSDIVRMGEYKSKDTIYYRVDKKWGKYFVTENSDAFLTNVIYYAMWYGFDIEAKGIISDSLLYQLKENYIPVISKSKFFMYDIDIKAKTKNEVYKSEGMAATGLSCGVDSFYTLYKHLTPSLGRFQIKCVLFQDWYSIGFDENKKEKWQNNFYEKTNSVSEQLGIDCIYVSCNIDEILPTGTINDAYYGYICSKGFYTYKYCSTAMALGKLISTYYFSSGYSVGEFNLYPKGKVFDEDHYSLFNIAQLQSGNVKFYHYGGDMSRIDKLKYISQYPIVRKYLSVCGDDENCGKCLKCIRTMGELYAIRKLDDYKDSFPVERFKRKIVYNFSVIIMNRSNEFCNDILCCCKQNHVRVPVMSYVIIPITWLYQICCKRFRNVKWMRRIFEKITIFR